MKTGIDSLDLEPTDPLMIDNFEVYREISAVTIQTKLKNVSFSIWQEPSLIEKFLFKPQIFNHLVI